MWPVKPSRAARHQSRNQPAGSTAPGGSGIKAARVAGSKGFAWLADLGVEGSPAAVSAANARVAVPSARPSTLRKSHFIKVNGVVH